MSQFLIRQAAKAIAGSAAPQVASQIASQIAQRLGAPYSGEAREAREAARRRFLIWLAGPFKADQPEAYDLLWERLRGDDASIDALTGVFLELQTAGPKAASQWFGQLAESDRRHFDELIAELSPKQPDAQKMIQQASNDAETTLRGAARFFGRTYRKTSEQARKRRS